MDKKQPYDIDKALEQPGGRGAGRAPETIGGAITRELSRAEAAARAAERHRGGERWTWQLGMRVVVVRALALLWLATVFFVAYEFLQSDAEVLRTSRGLTVQATLIVGGRMLLTIALTVVVALVAWQALQLEKWAARLLQGAGGVTAGAWWWLHSGNHWPSAVPGTEAIAAVVFGWWLPALGIVTMVVIAFSSNALVE